MALNASSSLPTVNELNAANPILSIEGLTVGYRQDKTWLEAVREITFSIRAGETYALVGESGSGKTTLALAVMRYLPENGAILKGRIQLAGRDLVGLSLDEMRSVWGKEIALVPQNPQSSLNPSLRVGEQMAETLRHHQGLSGAAAGARVVDLLARVHIADPERVASSYPHQISGGMQQRVMIAMALSTEPLLLILDEPTTSLDVTTQAVILDLISELIHGRQTAALYVTHNLGVVSQLCDRIAVLYAGELVEDAATADLFRQPLHPYSQGLIDSVPRLGASKDKGQLRSIKGQIPPLWEREAGCIFAARCPVAVEICAQRPPLYMPEAGRWSRCHRWKEILDGQIVLTQDLPPVQKTREARTAPDPTPVLKVDHLSTHYPVARSLTEWLARRPPRKVRAVDGVSLEIPHGKTLGLVGESGSGKTTLARTIMGLECRNGGTVELLNFSLPADLSRRDLESLRHLQMVFQNPEEAFNPYVTIGETLSLPLRTLAGKSAKAAAAEVEGLLTAVRLPGAYARRLPTQLSGGELQRVAIARAFVSNPDLLVGDEPVSSLDVSVQASILNLLDEMQVEHGSSLLLISHDLAVVGYLADIIAVIYLGRLMEVANAADLFEPPYHPYTEALLSAVPQIDMGAKGNRVRLQGEIPSPMNVPGGCPFHTRCPHFLGDICVQQAPPWQVHEKTGKRSFCHIPLDELAASQKRVLGSEN